MHFNFTADQIKSFLFAHDIRGVTIKIIQSAITISIKLLLFLEFNRVHC